MDNWANLEEKLGKEAFRTIRHDFGRKLNSFRDARDTVEIPRSVAAQLPHVSLADDPFEDLPSDCANCIFIAFVGKDKYLVNTEGFSYSRYIAKLKVI